MLFDKGDTYGEGSRPRRLSSPKIPSAGSIPSPRRTSPRCQPTALAAAPVPPAPAVSKKKSTFKLNGSSTPRGPRVVSTPKTALSGSHIVIAANQSKATTAVLWLHGFGDGPEGWASEFASAQSAYPGVHWVLMRAPRLAQTCYGGREVPAWGDYLDEGCTSVGSSDYDNSDIVSEKVVADAHALLDNLVLHHGVPPGRILVGGFSMGAAAAAEVALRYSGGALGGLMMLNGWLTPRARAALDRARTLPARMLISHGTADEQVGFDAGEEAARLLRNSASSADAVAFHSHPGLDHVPSGFGPGKALALEFVGAAWRT